MKTTPSGCKIGEQAVVFETTVVELFCLAPDGGRIL